MPWYGKCNIAQEDSVVHIKKTSSDLKQVQKCPLSFKMVIFAPKYQIMKTIACEIATTENTGNLVCFGYCRAFVLNVCTNIIAFLSNCVHTLLFFSFKFLFCSE